MAQESRGHAELDAFQYVSYLQRCGELAHFLTFIDLRCVTAEQCHVVVRIDDLHLWYCHGCTEMFGKKTRCKWKFEFMQASKLFYVANALAWLPQLLRTSPHRILGSILEAPSV